MSNAKIYGIRLRPRLCGFEPPISALKGDRGRARPRQKHMKREAKKKIEVYATEQDDQRVIRVRAEEKGANDRYCLIAELPMLGGIPMKTAWRMGMRIAREYVREGNSAAAVVGVYRSTTIEPFDLDIVRVYEKWSTPG